MRENDWHALREWLASKRVIPAPLGFGGHSWARYREDQTPALISDADAAELARLEVRSMTNIRCAWFDGLTAETLADLERAGFAPAGRVA